ncbi:MAG: hypothetical protein H8E73_04695 [Planctomycetes bacterium]|nr:hypothetical protein [Planctomycetota bacterium]MBL7154478.1 hypothetical protein [Phycisphaerae bacterium]
MKRHMLYLVLAAMLLPTAAFSQEPESMEHAEQKFEFRNMQLEMAKRESELKFHEEMQRLEIEKLRVEIEHGKRSLGRHKPGCHPILGLCLVACLIVRILAAVWVYRDAHQRNAGSGTWVAITLLAGLFGVLTYAVVRLGDKNNARARK